MKNALNILAVITVAVSHLLIGSGVLMMGRAHRLMFQEFEWPLPLITQNAIRYTDTAMPLVVGGMLGAVSLAGLIAFGLPERTRAFLPILLAMSFVVALMHFAFVAYGVSLPLFSVTYSLQQ